MNKYVMIVWIGVMFLGVSIPFVLYLLGGIKLLVGVYGIGYVLLNRQLMNAPVVDDESSIPIR